MPCHRPSLAQAALLASGLSLAAAGPTRAREAAMELASTAFVHQQEIPARHTCDGPDLSPPLAWRDLPAGTRSLALVVDDPDAPDPRAPKMTWVHWVVFDLPPEATGLADGASGNLPAGAREGLNDWRKAAWGGPCPPIGRHRYFFKLYALDTRLPQLARPDKAALERAMAGHILARVELVGTYARK